MATTQNKSVYQNSFTSYVLKVQEAHKKTLKPQQIRFLRYPFITSVFWAKHQHKRIKKANIELYYNTIFKQLTFNF